jgi:4-methylaminobutanoate oxidase (formaldehyde-forming)
VTSGNYGHYLGGAVGLGYVSCEDIPITDLAKFHYEIDIAGTKYSATASTLPMYDPKSERIKM